MSDLDLHVDYGNRLSWKAPLSSPQFTQSQRDYTAGFGTGSSLAFLSSSAFSNSLFRRG
ncbi:hypothetical protein [Hymenobacter psychrophilus]|uniref:hypothetical protein n=1 Tax=Hymenobacter psychrophilus TaxID=651662 RepID=UPI001114A96F